MTQKAREGGESRTAKKEEKSLTAKRDGESRAAKKEEKSLTVKRDGESRAAKSGGKSLPKRRGGGSRAAKREDKSITVRRKGANVKYPLAGLYYRLRKTFGLAGISEERRRSQLLLHPGEDFKEAIYREDEKRIRLFLLCLIMGFFLAAFSAFSGRDKEVRSLTRPEVGGIEEETEILAEYDRQKYSVSLSLDSRILTDSEWEHAREEALEKAKKKALGDNPDWDHISRDLDLEDDDSVPGITVSWESSDPEAIGLDGSVKLGTAVQEAEKTEPGEAAESGLNGSVKLGTAAQEAEKTEPGEAAESGLNGSEKAEKAAQEAEKTEPGEAAESGLNGSEKAEKAAQEAEKTEPGEEAESGKKAENKKVLLTAIVTSDDRIWEQTVTATLLPLTLSGTEKILQDLTLLLKAAASDRSLPEVELPRKLDGKDIHYPIEDGSLIFIFPLMGLAAGTAILFLPGQKRRQEKKKREIELAAAYPELISNLTVLMNAGLTVRASWENMVNRYQYQKTCGGKTQILYEEMTLTRNALGQGTAEEEAYRAFARRCELQSYLRLGSLLENNIRRGSRGLLPLLREEAETAMEERLRSARKRGEEVSAKLLLPMMILLILVMVILMVPAFLAF